MSARKKSATRERAKQPASKHRDSRLKAPTTIPHPARKTVTVRQTSPVADGDGKDNQGKPKGGTIAKNTRQARTARPGTKLATIIGQLKQKGGTTIDALSKATGWQRHSVHGVISGIIRTKMGIAVQTEVKDGVHYYRIMD